MLQPIDTDSGIKTYYDKVIHVAKQNSSTTRENKKTVQIWLKRAAGRAIVYDNSSANIVNNPLAMYVIPYDSFGTLITDNIASYAYHCRMYYKDY